MQSYHHIFLNVCSQGEFSLKRLQICINYFEKRGHRQIKAFLPHHRINRETYSGLTLMERQGTVVFTPSRKVNGKRVASYDDRMRRCDSDHGQLQRPAAGKPQLEGNYRATHTDVLLGG
uniref:RNase NYN domain-containing protein n=1 Tax=Cuerna arida TaxID=1464854 RepID=A0A1B6FNR0_9HEMI